MSEQRQHDSINVVARTNAEGDDPARSAARLADARAELDQVYAAADAIMEAIRQGDSARVLEQMRQSGGQ